MFPHGRTPLRFAVQRDVADLLVRRGADLSARNEKGETPLDLIYSKETGRAAETRWRNAIVRKA